MSIYDDQDLCRECGAHFSDPHDTQCANGGESEHCELCNWSEQDTGALLDGVCERCNPESHASERGEVYETN